MRAVASPLLVASLLAFAGCGGQFESGGGATGAGGAGATSTGAGGSGGTVTTPTGVGGAGQGGGTTVTSAGGAPTTTTTVTSVGGAGGAGGATSWCGDGIQDAGEECDDGNKIEEDTCTNQCTQPKCGDGVGTRGEICLGAPDLVQLAAGAKPGDVKLADFDGDGLVDLAIAEAGAGRVNVFGAVAPGSFTPRASLSIDKPYRFAVGPVTGLLPDVVVGSFHGSLVRFFRNASTPSSFVFTQASEMTAPNATQVSLGRIAGDAIAHVAVGLQATAQVAIAKIDGTGALLAPVTIEVEMATTAALLFPRDVGAPLTDGLAIGSYAANTQLALRYAEGGAFAGNAAVTVPVDQIVSIVGADFNEDGRTDLAGVRTGDHHAFDVVLSNGPDAMSNIPVLHDVPGAYMCNYLVTADFDRDDHVDLAVSCMGHPQTADGLVAIFRGVGDGDFEPDPVIAAANLAAPLGLDAGDVNGDGFPDLAIALSEGDQVALVLSAP